VNAGLQEVITYALTTLEREAALGLPPDGYVRLLNPISSDRVVMRHSVLSSVLEIASANLRHTDTVKVFEIGSVYLPREGAKLPDEPRRLAVVLTGCRQPGHWGETIGPAEGRLNFFDLKGVIEALGEDLHLAGLAYQPSQAAHLHPGKAAELRIQGELVGTLGELHPRVAPTYDLADRSVLVAELDLARLLAAAPARFTYTPVSRFPAALRDIAVIVDNATPAERVVGEIRVAGGEMLRAIRLFDLYRGESIPAGTKSLAFALSYQADDRTLTDKEVDKAHKKIEERLKHVLKAQIRGLDRPGDP
jgi:phenylalanyl-tRNA synthetase beta chain